MSEEDERSRDAYDKDRNMRNIWRSEANEMLKRFRRRENVSTEMKVFLHQTW